MHNPQYQYADSIFATELAKENSTSQVVTQKDAAHKDAKDNQREELNMLCTLPKSNSLLKLIEPGPASV